MKTNFHIRTIGLITLFCLSILSCSENEEEDPPSQINSEIFLYINNDEENYVEGLNIQADYGTSGTGSLTTFDITITGDSDEEQLFSIGFLTPSEDFNPVSGEYVIGTYDPLNQSATNAIFSAFIDTTITNNQEDGEFYLYDTNLEGGGLLVITNNPNEDGFSVLFEFTAYSYWGPSTGSSIYVRGSFLVSERYNPGD